MKIIRTKKEKRKFMIKESVLFGLIIFAIGVIFGCLFLSDENPFIKYGVWLLIAIIFGYLFYDDLKRDIIKWEREDDLW